MHWTFIQSFSRGEEYCSVSCHAALLEMDHCDKNYSNWRRTAIRNVWSHPKLQCLAWGRFSFWWCVNSLPSSEILLNLELWPLPGFVMCGAIGPCAGQWPQLQVVAHRGDEHPPLLSYCGGEARGVLHLLGRRSWWKSASKYDLGLERWSSV